MSRKTEPQVRVLVFRLASREAIQTTYIFCKRPVEIRGVL